MQYRTFKIDDQEGINNFVKENSKLLARDSVIISEENISFLYSTQEEIDEMDALEESKKKDKPSKNIHEVGLQKTIDTCLMEWVEKDLARRVYKDRISQLEFLAEKSGKGLITLERDKQYKNLVALLEDTESAIRNAETTIKNCTEMIEQIKTGEYKLPLGFDLNKKVA